MSKQLCHNFWCCCCDFIILIVLIILLLLFVVVFLLCWTILQFLTLSPPACDTQKSYIFASIRILTSLVELVILVLYVLFKHDNVNDDCLMQSQHSRIMCMFGLSCLFMYWIGYSSLMPDIRLPDNVPIRSKIGYAYLGNIRELERIWRQYLKHEVIKNYRYMFLDKFKKKISNRVSHIEQDYKQLSNDIAYTIKHLQGVQDPAYTLEVLRPHLNEVKYLQNRVIANRENCTRWRRQYLSLEKFKFLDEIEQLVEPFWNDCIKFAEQNNQEAAVKWLKMRFAKK